MILHDEAVFWNAVLQYEKFPTVLFHTLSVWFIYYQIMSFSGRIKMFVSEQSEKDVERKDRESEKRREKHRDRS